MADKRVVRLVVFEGPEDQVDQQLAQSLPDGYRMGSGAVKISTLTLDYVDVHNLRTIEDPTCRTIEERLAALEPAPYGNYAGLAPIRPERELAIDHEILRFSQVHHLRQGERYLMAFDKAAYPPSLLQRLADTLRRDMQIVAVFVQTRGNPADAIKIVDLKETT